MTEKTEKLQDEPAKQAVTLEEVLGMIKGLSDRLAAIEGKPKEEPKKEEEPKEEKPVEEMSEKGNLSKLEKEVSELKEALSKVENRKTVITKDEPIKKELTKQVSANAWILNMEE